MPGEGAESDSEKVEQRHPSLYLEDGDLVISAVMKSDKNMTQLFCVHKALLDVTPLSSRTCLPLGKSQRMICTMAFLRFIYRMTQKMSPTFFVHCIILRLYYFPAFVVSFYR